MKIAREIARAVVEYEVVRMGKSVCADELEPTISENLVPVREVLLEGLNAVDGDAETPRKAISEALSMFEEA